MAPADSVQLEVSESQSSSKRRRTEQTSAEDTATTKEDFLQDEELSLANNAGTEQELRFAEGQKVACNMSQRCDGFLWRAGTIIKLWHVDDETTAPYLVELDDGRLAAAPEDDDDCIRSAARAGRETRILRLFALPEDKQAAVKLRFLEGDRVAVQLNIGNWEEGVIVETWAKPQKNGKPLKTWSGVSVPYAVRLDLGYKVFVPFDSDDVIRLEGMCVPPQKSIAEQLRGVLRTEAQARFLKRKKSSDQWVLVDTKTGFERPCRPSQTSIELSDCQEGV